MIAKYAELQYGCIEKCGQAAYAYCVFVLAIICGSVYLDDLVSQFESVSLWG